MPSSQMDNLPGLNFDLTVLPLFLKKCRKASVHSYKAAHKDLDQECTNPLTLAVQAYLIHYSLIPR